MNLNFSAMTDSRMVSFMAMPLRRKARRAVIVVGTGS
jgi:hypothetical protein